MNIILHIGQSKTGTTALQSFLSRNRKKLAKEHSILYPDVYLKGRAIELLNHNAFANALNGYDFHPRLTADQYWEQFMEQYKASGCKTLLLSGESFFGGRPYLWEFDDINDYYSVYKEKLEVLKRYTGENELKIVVYLRPQMQWLTSAIPQIIRYEGTMQQRIYEDDAQITQMLVPCMNYERLMSEWGNVLSPAMMYIKEYNRENLTNQNIILDFLDLINVSPSDFEINHPKDHVHESWSREIIEFKKELNLAPKSRIAEDTIIDILDRHNAAYGRKEKYILPPEIQKFVFETFHEGNEKLSRQYNDGKAIFSKEAPDFDVLEYVPVSAESVLEAKARFFKTKRSFEGYRTFLYNAFKRFLKKTSPYLFSYCSSLRKKIKKT